MSSELPSIDEFVDNDDVDNTRLSDEPKLNSVPNLPNSQSQVKKSLVNFKLPSQGLETMQSSQTASAPELFTGDDENDDDDDDDDDDDNEVSNRTWTGGNIKTISTSFKKFIRSNRRLNSNDSGQLPSSSSSQPSRSRQDFNSSLNSGTSSQSNGYKSPINYFRNLIGARANDDYRSDAEAYNTTNVGSSNLSRRQAMPGSVIAGSAIRTFDRRNARASASAYNSPAYSPGYQGNSPTNNTNTNDNNRKRCCSRIFCFNCCCNRSASPSNDTICQLPKQKIYRTISSILTSRVWRMSIFFFNFILLFGAQIQELWMPKSIDMLFTVLFTMTFVILFIDIIFRCLVEPMYFPVCGKNIVSSSLYPPSRGRGSTTSPEQDSMSLQRRDTTTGGGGGGGGRSSAYYRKSSYGSSTSGHDGRQSYHQYRTSSMDTTAGYTAASVGNTGGGNGAASINRNKGKNYLRYIIGSFMFWCDFISTMLVLTDISYVYPRMFSVQRIDIFENAFGIPVGNLNDINTSMPISGNYELIIVIGRTLRVARIFSASQVVETTNRVNWYWILDRMNPIWYIKRLWKATVGQNTTRRLSLSSLNDLGEVDGEGGSDSNLESSADFTFEPTGFKGFGTAILRIFGLAPSELEEIHKREMAAIAIQRAWRLSSARTPANIHTENSSEIAWQSTHELNTDGADGRTKSYDITPFNDTVATNAIDVNAKNENKNILKKSAARISILTKRTDGNSSTHPRRSRQESQVGSAMREITGQRVAIGIIAALLLTVLFTYSENDSTRPATMIVLHAQTSSQGPNTTFSNLALTAAKRSSTPDLYQYVYTTGYIENFTAPIYPPLPCNPGDLRDREILRISINRPTGAKLFNGTTVGYFCNRQQRKDQARVELCTTIFMLVIWFFGVTAFAGPVMTLVVNPIERMVRLLDILMLDPLGYETQPSFKKFLVEEDKSTRNSKFTREQLKGMETSFLKSTILRIGSLMKVGFGSAGVEIIRNNLERGQKKDTLILTAQGSTIFSIFLFCDIRQFTDATESLQEEVFLFTNKIAGVVHSICHSYGGSANKNIGDAFLLTWLLEDESYNSRTSYGSSSFSGAEAEEFTAKHNQADKALLSVVKICIAIQHDNYYLESMSETARDALLAKLSKRKGPVVQMGFGLHAGKAIQGALGSQRKIDATYVSESVERSEFLESSTKKYGLKMLMSDCFHRLLHPSNRRRCRKIDQILLNSDDTQGTNFDTVADSDVMELFTFDMDIDALWRHDENEDNVSDSESLGDISISRSGRKYNRVGGGGGGGGGGIVGGGGGTGNAGGVRENSTFRRRLSLSKTFTKATTQQALENSSKSEEFTGSGGLRGSRISDRRGSGGGGGGGGSGEVPLFGSAGSGGSGGSGNSNNNNNNNTGSGGGGGSSGGSSVGGGTGEGEDGGGTDGNNTNTNNNNNKFTPPELVLPKGKALYNANVWLSEDMRKIRKRYSDGIFFQKFNSGLQSFYSGNWDDAKQAFTTILERFDDGPSMYFLSIIDKNNGTVPRNFIGYGTVD